jgi:hypothetical protein
MPVSQKFGTGDRRHETNKMPGFVRFVCFLANMPGARRETRDTVTKNLCALCGSKMQLAILAIHGWPFEAQRYSGFL